MPPSGLPQPPMLSSIRTLIILGYNYVLKLFSLLDCELLGTIDAVIFIFIFSVKINKRKIHLERSQEVGRGSSEAQHSLTIADPLDVRSLPGEY